MSWMQSNKHEISCAGEIVYIDDKEYKKPGKGHTVVQCGERIFINGYEFKNGKFKRTLRAILECYVLF